MPRTPLTNPIHLLIPLSFFVLASSCNNATPRNDNSMRGMFIFGSSIVDNGNNNQLFGDFTKANFMPYGLDFPSGPTGRFSNGKNVADLIANHLKLPLVPPFSDLRNKRDSIVNGVNFASGGSGIQDETGALLGVTSLNNQIKKFKDHILPKLESQIGCKAQIILPHYLFLVGAGNNDYSIYYLLQQTKILSPLEFAAKLMNRLSAQLKQLYDLGARKFLLLSAYPVGCNPVLTKEREDCVKELNEAVHFFYDQLMIMVKHKEQKMPEAQFSVVNSAKIIEDIIKNANAIGFINADCACCETSKLGSCIKGGKTCPNRDIYVYFDGLHLTEAASTILATKACNSTDHREVFVNLQKLTQV